MGEGVAPQFVLVAEAPAALETLVRPEVAQSNVVVAGHPGGESGRAMFAGKYLKVEEFYLIYHKCSFRSGCFALLSSHLFLFLDMLCEEVRPKTVPKMSQYSVEEIISSKSSIKFLTF